MAIFYRTNAQSRVFEEVFMRSSLPYKVVGGLRFYERKEVKDLLAYLRVLVNPDDEVSLRRIINTPKRGIGDRALDEIESIGSRNSLSFWQALHKSDEAGLAGRTNSAITAFVSLMAALRVLVEQIGHRQQLQPQSWNKLAYSPNFAIAMIRKMKCALRT